MAPLSITFNDPYLARLKKKCIAIILPLNISETVRDKLTNIVTIKY